MSLGTEYNLTIHRGDDRQITGVVVDEAGSPVDITGAAITYAVAPLDEAAEETAPQPKNGSTAIITKSTGSGGLVITDAPNGGIRVDLGSGDTAGLPAPKTYYHEIQIVLGGFTTTIMFGTFTIRRELIAPGP